jgi:hypothetical protein
MSRSFQRPRPQSLMMWVLGFVNRWLMLLGLPIFRRIPIVRDLPLIRGYFRIRAIDFPAPDRARLATAVNRNTAAFVGPNHPEFGFDWIMDKEIQTLVAPRMASWASHGIIASAPWFWTRNNLISHNGGEAAMEHSVAWALQGDGVLLHPEGTVRWTGDVVHPLFQGIAEMACATAPRGAQPVFVVPIVWKLQYVTDISAALHREMTYIERSLGLDEGSSINLAERFGGLQEKILRDRMRVHGFDAASIETLDYFARQEAFRDHLLADLGSRYEIEPAPSVDKTIARYQRAISAELRQLRDEESPGAAERRGALTLDLARADEASRLNGFSRDAYATPRLTQEQIAESLKRHRATLLTSGRRNMIHNFLPTPYGPRIAHVRVPEPILIDPIRASGGPAERQAYVTELVGLARARMQDALDRIIQGIAAETTRYSHRNPFGGVIAGLSASRPPVSLPTQAHALQPAVQRPAAHPWRHSRPSPRS